MPAKELAGIFEKLPGRASNSGRRRSSPYKAVGDTLGVISHLFTTIGQNATGTFAEIAQVSGQMRPRGRALPGDRGGRQYRGHGGAAGVGHHHAGLLRVGAGDGQEQDRNRQLQNGDRETPSGHQRPRGVLPR